MTTDPQVWQSLEAQHERIRSLELKLASITGVLEGNIVLLDELKRRIHVLETHVAELEKR